MAEAAVGFLINRLANLIDNEAAIISGVDSQLRDIKAQLQFMLSFLKDADAERKRDERKKTLVKIFIELAQDAEVIIEAFTLRINNRSRGFVARYVFCFNKWIARRRVFKGIEEIKNRLKGISDTKSLYGIENLGSHGEGNISSSSESLQDRRRDFAFAEEQDVVGFDMDIKVLVSQLISEETHLRVVSIVGMGGLGKTTLAKKVYRCEPVKQHFDCRALVYVSQVFKTTELLFEIAKQISILEKSALAKMDRQELQEELRNLLKNRRYLIVLDDVWKPQLWADLKTTFPEEENRSRILFTTRIRDVALYADPRSSPHELQLLSMNQAWELFTRKVFLRLNSCPPEMEKVGRQIVDKCGGLPLAIVVVGGLLCRKQKTATVWQSILGNLNRKLAQEPENLPEILALSYHDLPYHLKSCFLYLGVFLEDFEIKASKLIQLWAAEGFLEQTGGGTMEEVGEDYLEELVCRSMVQIAKRKADGRIKTCRIHDLLRDWAIEKSKEVNFLGQLHADADCATSLTTTRRIVVHSKMSTALISLSQSNPRVRSLLCFNKDADEYRRVDPIRFRFSLCFNQDADNLKVDPMRFFCRGFRFLTVLELEVVPAPRIPKEIGKLIHLRYLTLRGMLSSQLPSSMVNLQNLQSFKAREYFSITHDVIWKLQQLRHLYVDCKLPRKGKPILSTNLQTLCKVEVGAGIESFLFQLTNLRKLELRGPLRVYESELSRSLSKLSCLRSLKLNVSLHESIPTSLIALSDHTQLYKLVLDGRLSSTFPDCHELPPNLAHLYLCGTMLHSDSFVKIQKLPNLKVLELIGGFVNEKLVVSAGGFPRLETLSITGTPTFKEWVLEEGAMPSLRDVD